jgi:hypothetical protein
VIVTIRSGGTAPDAVTALWKERLLLRLDVGAFTRAQIEKQRTFDALPLDEAVAASYGQVAAAVVDAG